MLPHRWHTQAVHRTAQCDTRMTHTRNTYQTLWKPGISQPFRNTLAHTPWHTALHTKRHKEETKKKKKRIKKKNFFFIKKKRSAYAYAKGKRKRSFSLFHILRFPFTSPGLFFPNPRLEKTSPGLVTPKSPTCCAPPFPPFPPFPIASYSYL